MSSVEPKQVSIEILTQAKNEPKSSNKIKGNFEYLYRAKQGDFSTWLEALSKKFS